MCLRALIRNGMGNLLFISFIPYVSMLNQVVGFLIVEAFVLRILFEDER